MNKFRNINKRK